MHNLIILCIALVSMVNLAHAELAVDRVRALLNGQTASIAEMIELAEEFRAGKGTGIWQSDCLAAYFYKTALDTPKLDSSGDIEKLADASVKYAHLVENKPGCTLAINVARTPSTPLNQLVIVNGQLPPLEASDPSSTPSTTPTKVHDQQPTINIDVSKWVSGPPPKFPAPFDSGRPIDELMISRQRSDSKADEVGKPSSPNGAVVVEAHGSDCTEKWSQYAHMQELMGDAAEMSLLTYLGPERLTREAAKLKALEDNFRAATAEKRVFLNLQLKPAEAKFKEITKQRSLLVSSLRSKGYKEDRNLSDSFYAFKNYSKSELDEKGFYFDIYQRKGSFWAAFRGTANLGGGVADLKQIMNIDVDQSVYEYANQLIAFLTGKNGIDPSRIATTGHSLGGGLATYSHLLNNAAFALNFNPAELGAVNNVRVPNDAVRKRVINYLSYEPGSETADFVHQGTKIAKELFDSPKIPEGYIYGNSYYLPIEIGPSTWHLAKKLAIASGSKKLVTTGVRKFARHPIISTVKVGYAGAKTYVDIESTEQATWANFQLHSLDPLAQSISNLVSSQTQLVCGMPAQPSGVKTQLKPQSRWEALKKVRPNRKQAETDG